jgi:hypothetical protein
MFQNISLVFYSFCGIFIVGISFTLSGYYIEENASIMDENQIQKSNEELFR